MPDDPFRGVVLSPEARALFCRQFGMMPAEVDALLERENDDLATAYAAFRATHPNAPAADVAREIMVSTLIEVGTDAGLTPEQARARAHAAIRRLLPP